jgi:hypothetical protein
MLMHRLFLEIVDDDADWPFPAASALGGGTVGAVPTSRGRFHLPAWGGLIVQS